MLYSHIELCIGTMFASFYEQMRARYADNLFFLSPQFFIESKIRGRAGHAVRHHF